MNNQFFPERIIKQVENCLKIRKGSFPYDTELGSNLYRVDTVDKSAEKNCKMMVEEALLRLPEVSIKGCELKRKNGECRLLVKFMYLDKEYETEVIV